MHASGAPRRRTDHRFSNHTPRQHEVQQNPARSGRSSAMLNPTGMTVSPNAVPSIANPIREHPVAEEVGPGKLKRGHTGSLQGRDVKPAPKQDVQPTLHDIPAEVSSQGPFLDEMMTQTNLLVLPPSNPSYKMAVFLKSTGPLEATSKRSRGKKIVSAMRFFKSNSRGPSEKLAAAHLRLNDVVPKQDETPALSAEQKLPRGVVQKVSKNGRKYLQIEETPHISSTSVGDCAPSLNVSVCFPEQSSSENLSNWMIAFEDEAPASVDIKTSGHDSEAASKGACLSSDRSMESTVRILDASDNTPGKSPAEQRAAPAHDGRVSITPQISHDTGTNIAPLRSHPVVVGSPSLLPPPSRSDKRAVSVQNTSKPPQLAHPTPRRVGSQSTLLKGDSSDITGLHWSRDPALELKRVVQDSPGPPPPRSPLRINNEGKPRMIENVMDRTQARGNAPSPEDMRLRNAPKAQHPALRAPSVLDLTALPQIESRGRVKSIDTYKMIVSVDENDESHDKFNASKVLPKAVKSNARLSGTIDPLKKSSQSNTPRRRLKRARPDGPRPLDLAKLRAHTSTTNLSGVSCAGALPMKHTGRLVDISENVRVATAAHAGSPKIGYIRRPTNAFLRGRKSPVSRPRSARLTVNSRAGTPDRRVVIDETPKTQPVSPPPMKELPPTPTRQSTASQLSRDMFDAKLARAGSIQKTLPSPPIADRGNSLDFPSPPSSTRTAGRAKAMRRQDDQATTPVKNKPLPPRLAEKAEENEQSRLEARLAAIERRNRLLEAALMAVLKTSGTLNGCPCNLETLGATEHVCAHNHQRLHHNHHHHHQPHASESSTSTGAGIDVLDIFKETKVRY
ncbi:hypothetical protein AAFC00_001419 [Neodothiora populina]|uniref:Proteophosphoglycan ppg4 n=1 Tax=Neodothiora populina TaxID=2781224 RepID=A0ABR3PPX8_9PEZI